MQWAINIILICFAFHRIKNKTLLLICQTHQLLGHIHLGGIWRMFHCFESCIFRRKDYLLPTPGPLKRETVEEDSPEKKWLGLYAPGKVTSFVPSQPPSRTTGQFCSIAFVFFLLLQTSPPHDAGRVETKRTLFGPAALAQHPGWLLIERRCFLSRAGLSLVCMILILR